jgi:opacity protein-like surface antigen
MPLGAKASVDVLGDAGEGGATLDYQVGGLLNYQVKPKWTLQGGWRYLTVHYGNNGNIFNSSIQGILIGATYKFK